MDSSDASSPRGEDGQKISFTSDTSGPTPDLPIDATPDLEPDEEFGLYTTSGADVVLKNFFRTPRPTPFKVQKSTKAENMSKRRKVLRMEDLEKQMTGLGLQDRSRNHRKRPSRRISSPILVKYDDALKIYHLPSNYSGFSTPRRTPASGVFSPYPTPKYPGISQTATYSPNSTSYNLDPYAKSKALQVSLIQSLIHKFEKQRIQLQKILDDSDDALERRVTCTIRDIGIILDNRRGHKTEMAWILAKIKELLKEFAEVEASAREKNAEDLIVSSLQDLDLSDGSSPFADDA